MLCICMCAYRVCAPSVTACDHTRAGRVVLKHDGSIIKHSDTGLRVVNISFTWCQMLDEPHA